VPWKQSPAFASLCCYVDKLPCSVHEGRGKCWRFPRKKSFYVGVHCRHYRVRFDTSNKLSILVAFRYGLSDNQTLPPSTAAQKTFTIGTLIAIAIAASHWLPEPLLALAPEFDAAHFLPFLALFLAALFAALLALLRHLLKL
jgi:hypothetical protein